MYAIWLIVEKAMMRLMSVWTMAISPDISRPTTPMMTIRSSTSGACTNSGFMRAIRYTPAVTNVAAWIRALIGVGPSIASGSHVWSGSCADLATAPTSRRRQAIEACVSDSSLAPAKMPLYVTVPRSTKRRKMPSARPTSPMAFMMKAFLAALMAFGLLCQKPISR